MHIRLIPVSLTLKPLFSARSLTSSCEEIKATAPTRGNKAKGIKSAKELREAEYAKFNDAVSELAEKFDVKTGKWLLYPGREYVDQTWAKIVKEVAGEEGKLAATGCVHTAKVSTVASGDGDRT